MSHDTVCSLWTTKIIFVVKNSILPLFGLLGVRQRLGWKIDQRGPGLPFHTGAKEAKREVRVRARGRSSSQATIRSTLMAAAVAICCKWVFASPR